MKKIERFLLLEDGSLYQGEGFGGSNTSFGEVIFNTAMTGYQETLSDPSYFGQIITFTYPLIGNYGINKEDFESKNPTIKGVIVKEYCKKPSNFRYNQTLEEFLREKNIPGIAGIDTRSLTKKIRKIGALRGCIINSKAEIAQALKQLQNLKWEDQAVENVTQKMEESKFGRASKKIIIINLGVKQGIIEELKRRDCEVLVADYNTTSEEIIQQKPDGVVISNGPGNPKNAHKTIEVVRKLLGKVPIFGICLGHQILALAGGAKTFKLKFGHHGVNHPVLNVKTKQIEITTQNHGFAVEYDSIKNTDFEVTHVALNDNVCEGIKHKIFPAFSVQYHPEANPGPRDANHHFDSFLKMIKNWRK